jgi:alpha-2-macroglobulin
MKNTFLALLAVASLVLLAPAPRAEPQSPPTNFDRVQRADGARVVPEKFLRDWDPVTVFFDSDAGPKNGGPADAHEKFATLSPEPAGEWRWLGPRALRNRGRRWRASW